MTASTREMSVTRHDRFLSEPLSPLPEGQKGVCGLGRLWQLSPTQAGLIANIRSWGTCHFDLELGNDLIVLDNLDRNAGRSSVPLNRTGPHHDPETDETYFLSKYGMTGGFVPLNALRADGSPHPYAGTGFGICHVHGYETDDNGGLINGTPNCRLGASGFHRAEMQQYRFDGETFEVLDSRLFALDEFLRGWNAANFHLGGFVADGDDILLGICAHRTDEEPVRTPHLGRFTCRDGRWRLTELTLVSKDGRGFGKPSLARDADGALLYAARGSHRQMPAITLWRSTDGVSWEMLFQEIAVRADAPMTINVALNGVAYIVSCPPAGDDYGNNAGCENSWLWPLSDDRRRLLAPLVVRDCFRDFGEPTHDLWRADHAVGQTVRLADKQWHHLLTYRVMEQHGAPSTAGTGLCVEELETEMCITPPWDF